MGNSGKPPVSGPQPLPTAHSPLPTLTVFSPCKINLFLDVVSRRADGFHEVVTIIEPLALSDRLNFTTTAAGIEVTVDHPEVPDGEDNIVHRAARLLLAAAGTAAGVSIRIEKKIPVAAGLGGGSGNAASALLALNRLWGLGLGLPDLTALAGKLGSDVPFFLSPRTSLWRGRGERGRVLSSAPPFFAVLINPGFPLSTRRAYQELNLDGTARPTHPNLEEIIAALERFDLNGLGSALFNRFQEAFVPRYPRIRELLEFFRAQKTSGALLSGSGPTVVGLTGSRKAAERIADAARDTFPPTYRIFVTSNTLPAESIPG